jgi:hypothetical protein
MGDPQQCLDKRLYKKTFILQVFYHSGERKNLDSRNSVNFGHFEIL